ncbi:pyridoxamine 5'-phosphate oxidase family protein [Glaciibacter psychrotolerans]|uniref:Nitroimidazol reductase NimA-like FMN-containing flavoprotein (Pyridoxamine 5'-phosphate oxidase superfamily) n=1 Tax=Glaciibacter psychrotolerans TaxID=670054 RepID=A0A7Z0ECU1_9MICO|nr:pyridoxamine 5'-phosphate oxidase family protein [Leifsonia psychrotolerans]NYJ18659.1 nitroimidazol reductase NimA-like FMN-containing flavoprotein (pyridoxamine 5'-phosphate oxidase superfamily) [Leifsonia psychrotolerans]
MEHDEGPVHTLTEAECWDFLTANSLGRIATHVHDVVDIVPVNFYADGSSILFRTAPGSKLLELTINDNVAFEIDGYDDQMGWGVVVKGTAHALDKQSDIAAAEASPLHPWIPTLKQVYVRITPTHITGMRFERGPEPEPDPY